MPGLLKLLVLAAILAAVWFGFNVLRRLNAAERALARRGPAPKPPAPSTHDLVACPECGTFVSPGQTRSCGRSRCPYGP